MIRQTDITPTDKARLYYAHIRSEVRRAGYKLRRPYFLPCPANGN